MDEKGLEEIIVRMPLTEKVAQLCGVFLPSLLIDGKLSAECCEKEIPHGVGHVCQFGCSTNLYPDELTDVMEQLRQYVKRHTEVDIPILFHEEAITGPAIKGATVTPQMIGMSCTWDPELVRKNAVLAARSLKKMGSYYALSPMMDVITDARWGRGEEGYGEDPLLVTQFALAFIEGLQSEGVAATAKHYAGYGEENQDMAYFRNEVLPPFEAAVKLGKVKAIMPGYHTFHDIPCTASKFLLQTILRDEFGFDGVVVSDYGAIGNVDRHQHYVKTNKEAAAVCLKAGVDIDFPNGASYKELLSCVEEGLVTVEEIDTALRRVLTLKKDVGRIEIVSHVSTSSSEKLDLDPLEYREQSLVSAQQSIVLLKNNGILPFVEVPDKIAVVGPNADSYYSLLGDYTWGGIAEFFHGRPASRLYPKLVTLLDGLKDALGEIASLRYERGCDWSQLHEKICGVEGGDQRGETANTTILEPIPSTDWNKAIKLAEDSDVIVAAMGENRFLCGECCNREEITLPGEQEQFVRELCETGKPVILIVFGGRPMAIAELAEQCAAVLYAWYPGEEGGHAMTDILMGKINPSAKLSVTLPDCQSHVPVCYRKRCRDGAEKFPFGFGESYTQYMYSGLMCPKEISTGLPYFDVYFTISNIGEWDGIETAQLYLISKNQSEKKRLIGFVRTAIDKETSKVCAIRFYPEQFAEYDEAGNLLLVSSVWNLQVGASSEDIRLERELVFIGETQHFTEKKHFFAEKLID